MAWLSLVLAIPTPAALALGAPPPISLADPPAITAPASPLEAAPTHLTLLPPPRLGDLPNPLLGTSGQVDMGLPAALRQTPIERIGPPGLLDLMANVIDTQDVEWPTGTTTSVHIQPKTDAGLGRWVPYASALQDVDEFDAHERYGVGVGATYRFNNQVRFDVEGQYLDRSGDVNPVLRSEGRVFGLFTISF